jgi:hypothetical protein
MELTSELTDLSEAEKVATTTGSARELTSEYIALSQHPSS